MGRYFAGGFRHVVWQSAVPDAVADPNLKKLFDIGVAGLTLMVPFLAAYIGYSIAERSALAPCAIGAGW